MIISIKNSKEDINKKYLYVDNVLQKNYSLYKTVLTPVEEKYPSLQGFILKYPNNLEKLLYPEINDACLDLIKFYLNQNGLSIIFSKTIKYNLED